MTNLKPCPFCGGRAHIDHYPANEWFTESFCIKHTCKGGSGDNRRISVYASGFAAEADAIDAWNRRVHSDD